MPQAQRWVDLQRWVEGGLEHALPSTPEAIAAALHEVADDWSVELIVEVGDPGWRGRMPGNPKLIVSACEGRLAVGALMAPERAVYYLVGDQAAVGEVAFTFGGQPGGTWPRRYLVDVDHAIAVAQDFLATAAVEQSTGHVVESPLRYSTVGPEVSDGGLKPSAVERSTVIASPGNRLVGVG